MKDDIKRSRGYATWWEWARFRRLERSRRLGARPFPVRRGRRRCPDLSRPDPPDVVLPVDGRRIGIEVTEIIDPKAVETARS